ncbi:telomerase protein component 1-like isoform X1 [Patiria miniata]|uniref:Telomerase protein component 1 n=1 Tax=Patiria miniata TaxID=46514 RepID=A0A914AWU6_PATMI|nr:telomerase protein component 1-like isoform X1 [Patiria miniata]XP_038068591.1 telomerase protein component 1-like isoform X1 [Patiria miniata]
MGCGSSNAAVSYQSDINTMWDQVSRTIDIQRNKDKSLVIRRSGWKTVRIFVSSTFRDFHAEREILVKEVFPDLRVWCEKRRLHLVDCDLRWGVPKDTTTEETLRTCLGEIDRCYQDNVMPFFLNLTSPTLFPASCFSGTSEGERCGWIPNQSEVPESIAADYRCVHGLSVTEMEIMHGAYRKDNFNSLFMIRDSGFLESVPEKHHKDFVDVNPIAPAKLKMLKQMLKDRFGSNQVHFYKCEYDGVNDQGKVEFKGLDKALGATVFKHFKQMISKQYPLEDSNLDPFQQAKEAHESFMKNRSVSVLGRTDILEQIKEHVVGVGVEVPLLLLGGPGTGKSSIMARVSDVTVSKALTKEIPGGGTQGWHVFYHFVGAVPGSPNLEATLKRLLKELGAVNDTTMPKDLETACQLTYATLSNPNTRPLIIVIDALNQFDESKESTILNWLPNKLSPQVRCIFSMIDETPQHKTLRSRPNKPTEVYVTPLDMTSREAIVKETLGKYTKRLDAQQMASLLSKDSSQNPLWLSVACEELRVFGSFESLSDKINSLADGLLNLLAQILTRFEQENGGEMLVATLCLLECSCHGLLETELLSILGDEDNLMPPKESSGKEKGEKESREKGASDIGPLSAHKWARVFRALKPFLRPFGDSGEGRLDFYHRSLSKAVRAKYFSGQTGNNAGRSVDRLYQWWHSKLANYFEKVANLERKAEEYPHHLIKINDKKQLVDFLLDWKVFSHYFKEDFSGELLSYWRQAADSMAEMEKLYVAQVEKLTDDPTLNEEDLSLLYEKVGRVLMHAGQLETCFSLLEKSMEIESRLGQRQERMVILYDLIASMHNERLILRYFYMDKKMMLDLKPAIQYRRKSLELGKDLTKDRFKFMRAFSLVKLAFNLHNWIFLSGDSSLSASEATDLGFDSLKEAKEIFYEFDDKAHVAECIMNEALLKSDHHKKEALEMYNEAEVLCYQACGEMSVLTSRIVINKAILLKRMRKVEEAYDYFYLGLVIKTQVKLTVVLICFRICKESLLKSRHLPVEFYVK